MLAFMLTQVFYYGFIFEVTRINKQDKFSNLNYIFPVLLSFLLLFAFFITPVYDQLNTIMAKGVYKGGSKNFFYFNYSKIFFRLIFSLVYTLLSFLRLSEYHLFIWNFSSNEEKNSLKWVSTLLLFSILLIPVPLVNMFSSREEMTTSPIAIFFVSLLLFKFVYVCLHVIKKDRYIIDLSDEFMKKREVVNGEIREEFQVNVEIEVVSTSKEREDEISPYLKKNVLSREFFDSFMKVEKPYLNADLRITDLVDMLHVNRTYISSFINMEYGVNFSVFINRYRLLEYKALKKNPEYCKMSKSELAEMAGFNSYRSFQRTEKEITEIKKRGLMGINILF
jgi:AraC-like DNA-binding protein